MTRRHDRSSSCWSLALAVPLLIYNRLVHLRNLTRESWRDIDTELQRRYDLDPESRQHGEGLRRARAADLRSGHRAARRRDGDDARARPAGAARAGARAGRRAAARGRRAVPRPEGERAVPRAAAPARRHRGPHPGRPAHLQRERPGLRHARRRRFPALLVARAFRFTPRPYFELDPIVRDAGPPPVDLSGRT